MPIIRKHGNKIAAVCTILVFLTVFSIINFCGFERYCTADMYSDTYLSRLMWQEKTIFPEDWVFGNQFYVFVTPVFAALFYGMCGSINLAMALATTTMTVLILLSFWWMVKPYASMEQILFGMAVLLGSIVGRRIETTIEGQIFYIMASYYSGYLVTLFVVFGVYVRARSGKQSGWVSMTIAVLLSFCMGMQSLRQTAVMVVPLMAIEGVRVLVRLIRERRLHLDVAARRAMACVAANILGLITIRILKPKAMPMFDSLAVTDVNDISESILQGLGCLWGVTGLKYLNSDLQMYGVIASVFVAVVVLAMIVFFAGRCKDSLGLLACLCAIGILSVMAVFVVFDFPYTRSIYMFPWYGMPALSAMMLLGWLRGRRKTAAGWVILAVLACNCCFSYLPTVYTIMRKPEEPRQQIAEYLLDNGYTRAYSDWYNASCVAAWTDGQVDAGCWTDEVCEILLYISPLDVYSEEDNDNAVYMISDGDLQAFLTRAEKVGARLELLTRFDNGYTLYTSDIQLMYFPE